MSRLRLLLFTFLYTCMFSAVGFSQDASTAAAQPGPAANDETLATDARADESSGDEVAAAASVADTIDNFFRVVVEKMATVLFWQPWTIEDVTYGDDLKTNSSAMSAEQKRQAAVFEAHDVGTIAKQTSDDTVTYWRLSAAKPATWEYFGETGGLPLIVLVLLLGSLFFTFYFRWLNVRGFRHAIDITLGKYDNPDDPGEISHFQALTSALSATVGLGNIAGVAVAFGLGGPGALLWMMVLGVFGMSAKLNECTLAQLYRQIDEDGTVHGGPMYYLEIGLKEKGLGALGAVLAFVFAVFCVLGSFGGGNMFQANQSFAALKAQIPALGGPGFDWAFGVVLAFMVGLVIIGGIKKIGRVTEKIIPFMVGTYLLAGVVVLLTHAGEIPAALASIFTGAFAPKAAFGGVVGVMVQGIKRAVFSNEAGIGSAAIAHSAAKTDKPAREGMVAMLGPFIDTVVICAMTGIILAVSHADQAKDAAGEALQGVEMTRYAFADTLSWFPWVLAVCILLFAYSTMISWSYYGEKAWAYLVSKLSGSERLGRGKSSILIYRVIFLGFVVLGTVSSLKNVIDFSDLMILSMAFPNVIGGILLAPRVKSMLHDYWARFKNNEFKRYS
jgi:AGCS family alanine or glycine:cation symporter